MSAAGRQEHLDDLMEDSNYKKMIGGDAALIHKFERAIREEKDARESYEDLKDRLPIADILRWERDADIAVSSRDHKLLRIFEMEDVESSNFAQVRNMLINQESLKAKDELDLLMEGLVLESEQDDLRNFIRSKARPTQTDLYKIQERRSRLNEKCAKYQQKAFQRMNVHSDTDTPELIDSHKEYRRFLMEAKKTLVTSGSKLGWENTDSGGESDDIDYYDEEMFIDGWWQGETGNIKGEEITLALPSSLSAYDKKRIAWIDAGEKEMVLRRTRINEILTELRLLLGEKIIRYQDLRQNRSQKTQKRGYNGLKGLQSKILGVQEMYRRQVLALKRLGEKKKWKDITKEDLGVMGKKKEQDRVGKSARDLAWFWRYGEDITEEVERSSAMDKCKLLSGLVNFLVKH
ncbi:hypothetical protein VKT23_004356 [Stygiomarasmius scandens]|uniref:Uncharacterized protein n=1 Tax=Marasmiellus scandens TaxID=2682957 RepID=A0ABR1JZP4_9AGAR